MERKLSKNSSLASNRPKLAQQTKILKHRKRIGTLKRKRRGFRLLSTLPNSHLFSEAVTSILPFPPPTSQGDPRVQGFGRPKSLSLNRGTFHRPKRHRCFYINSSSRAQTSVSLPSTQVWANLTAGGVLGSSEITQRIKNSYKASLNTNTDTYLCLESLTFIAMKFKHQTS